MKAGSAEVVVPPGAVVQEKLEERTEVSSAVEVEYFQLVVCSAEVDQEASACSSSSRVVEGEGGPAALHLSRRLRTSIL